MLINIPILVGNPKELFPTAPIKNPKDSIPVRLIPGGRVNLCLRFKVRSLISKSIMSPVVAI